jgi:hypothetical protein
MCAVPSATVPTSSRVAPALKFAANIGAPYSELTPNEMQ